MHFTRYGLTRTLIRERNRASSCCYAKRMPQSPQPCSYQTPWGPITLSLSGGLCHEISFDASDAPPCPEIHPATQWLNAYFSGDELPVLPFLAKARTPFQHRLRHALLAIPMGEVRTYGEIARALSSGPRAVGQALGANPLPILIPCHRVVAASGLGGFGGGLSWKKRLLDLERVTLPGNP